MMAFGGARVTSEVCTFTHLVGVESFASIDGLSNFKARIANYLPSPMR